MLYFNNFFVNYFLWETMEIIVVDTFSYIASLMQLRKLSFGHKNVTDLIEALDCTHVKLTTTYSFCT